MPSKRNLVRRITVAERAQIIAGIPLRRATVGRGDKPVPLLLLGDGGVASQEMGDVVGVSAEAPLPRVTIVKRKLTLAGICGIASTLRHWGLAPVVACPEGQGAASSLQRSLLVQDGIGCWPLYAGTHQIARYTQRVFAGGHQFTHLETDENIPPSRPREIKRSWSKILGGLGATRLLGIIDSGNTGVATLNLSELVKRAQEANIPVFYEPRTARLFPLKGFNVIKVNHNQMRQWYGASADSDEGSRAAAKMLLASTRAESIIYTMGERGILLYQHARGENEAILVEPEKKKLFDLVSVGDVVTAAVIFCLAQGRPLLEAVCLAATAAEYGLDRRYSKRLDLNSIYRLPTHQ